MDPYTGEIRIFGFNYAPENWATCDGQAMSMAQYTALYSVIGLNYGGNGVTTFNLPNFQGAAPMGTGNGPGLTPRVVGNASGATTVQLTAANLPAHNHTMNAVAANATAPSPDPTQMVAKYMNGSATASLYGAPSTPAANLAPQALGTVGGTDPHTNMQPYTALLFCICLEGEYPVRP
jgi:microcystin-dependent protein